MPYLKVNDGDEEVLVPVLSFDTGVQRIELKDLHVGDVLVWSTSSDKLDKPHSLIREGCKGIYSHAGIYIGNGRSLDAGPCGVAESIVDDLLGYFKIGLVMRLVVSPKYAEKAATVAQGKKDYYYSYSYALFQPIRKKMYLKKYSIKGRVSKQYLIMGEVSMFLKKIGFYNKKTFCSHLIAESYHEAGYDFGGYFEYSCLSPEDIVCENIFTPVGFLTNSANFIPEKFDSILSSGGEVLRWPQKGVFEILKEIIFK